MIMMMSSYFLFFFSPIQPNRDLDMFINASKNFNLNITWATSFTGKSMETALKQVVRFWSDIDSGIL